MHIRGNKYMKKVNKLVTLAGISLFSTVILSGITTPVKADDTNNIDKSSLIPKVEGTESVGTPTPAEQPSETVDTNPDVSKFNANPSDTESTPDSQPSQVSDVTTAPIPASTTDTNSDQKTITVNYIDQKGDPVYNNDGTQYTQQFSDQKNGNSVTLTAPTNYSFSEQDDTVTTQTLTIDDNNSYNVNVFGKIINGVALNIKTPEKADPSDDTTGPSKYNFSSLFQDSEGQYRLGDYYNISSVIKSKGQTFFHYFGADNMLDHFLGYKLQSIKHNDSGTDDTKLPIVKDPTGTKVKLTGNTNSIGFTTFDLEYGTPTQSLPVLAKFLDADGSEIKEDANFQVTPQKTYNIKDLAPNIDGYTFDADMTDYYMSTTPLHVVNSTGSLAFSGTYNATDSTYSPNWGSDKVSTSGSNSSIDTLNEIVFIYTKDDKSYNYINYVDQATGKTIYSYISPDPIATASELPKLSSFFEKTNSSTQSYIETGTPTLKDGTWTVPVEKTTQEVNEYLVINNVRIPFYSATFNIPDKKLPFKYPSMNIDEYTLSDDSTISSSLFPTQIPKLTDYPMVNPNDTSLKKLEAIIDVYSYTLTDPSNIPSFRNGIMSFNLIYKPVDNSVSDAKNITIKFQTSDGTDVKILPSTAITGTTDSPEDISQYLQDSADYKLISNVPKEASNDGTTLTLTFAVEPTKKPSTGGSGSSTPIEPNVDVSDNISVHPTIAQAQLYDDDGNEINKELPSNSDWHTDLKKTINGTTYYRVATNTWVKDSDVYIYFEQPTYVRTYLDSYKTLVNSQEKEVMNRALQAGSDWYSDRYAYFDGVKYYRVATNEWVKSGDVFEYTPIDNVITTTGNQIFNELGEDIGSLNAGIALKTDKIATINGDKMYRVATNEWIK